MGKGREFKLPGVDSKIAAMSEATIEAAGIAKLFAGRPVLQDVSLHVPAGDSLALIGLNGAGKTTLLRCLLDFQRPDRGSVRLAGVPAEPV